MDVAPGPEPDLSDHADDDVDEDPEIPTDYQGPLPIAG